MLNSSTGGALLSLVEIAASCALRRRCALALAELGQVVGAEAVRRAGCSHCSPRQRFEEDFVQSTLSVKHFHCDNNFLLICFQSHICEYVYLNSCNLKINRDKNNMQYLQGISFSQLPLA